MIWEKVKRTERVMVYIYSNTSRIIIKGLTLSYSLILSRSHCSHCSLLSLLSPLSLLISNNNMSSSVVRIISFYPLPFLPSLADAG